jgi:hypothetical protein
MTRALSGGASAVRDGAGGNRPELAECAHHGRGRIADGIIDRNYSNDLDAAGNGLLCEACKDGP